jgi:hypothetical protein
MEQCRSWEANSRLVSKFLPFYGTRRYISCAHDPATGPYPEPE